MAPTTVDSGYAEGIRRRTLVRGISRQMSAIIMNFVIRHHHERAKVDLMARRQ